MKALVLLGLLLVGLVLPPAVDARVSGGLVCQSYTTPRHVPYRVCRWFIAPETFVRFR